jgi:hypothetical protein
MASSAGPRLIQQSRALALQALDSGPKIGNFEGYVMQPFAAFFDKLRDY